MGDSPVKNQLIESVIDNMSLSNREQIIAFMRQANQPDPQAAQAAQAAQQIQLQFQQSQSNALNGQAQESAARAAKLSMETQVIPQEIEIDRIKAVTTNLRAGTEDDKEFERRIKMSEQLLREREVAVKEQTKAPEPSPTEQTVLRSIGGQP